MKRDFYTPLSLLGTSGLRLSFLYFFKNILFATINYLTFETDNICIEPISIEAVSIIWLANFMDSEKSVSETIKSLMVPEITPL